MKLLPREIDKLLIVQAGFLAQRRLARGILLNRVEATALICTVLLEHVRDGKLSLTEISQLGARLLGKRLVLPQVIKSLESVSLEANFPDGTKLITVHNPITLLDGNLAECLYGSFLPVPNISIFPVLTVGIEAGEMILASDPIIINKNRKQLRLSVTNNGDRPIQVGSHYHFIETNKKLAFDRKGMEIFY